MESEKPPSEPSEPSLEVILDNPSEDLASLEEIIEKTIPAPVEFVLCDPGIMRFLNLRWRHIDRATDVLTFDLSSDDEKPAGVVYIDGRLAPPLSEILERVYHGWLHLCGKTHDTEEDAEEMNRLTAELVAEGLGIAGKR